MGKFINKATGEAVEFVGDAADWAISSGQYTPAEGTTFETSLEGAPVKLPAEAVEFRNQTTTGAPDGREQLAGEAEQFGQHVFGGLGQQAITGAEGVASGLSLGGSDILLDLLGAETKERAQVNPGTRLGGQIVGNILPAIVTGGLSATPAGLAMSAGRAVEGAIGGRIAGAAAGAAVEGAIMGAGQGVGNLVISNEPLTASAIVNEVGINALLGGGLGGALGGGLAAAGKVGRAAAGAVKRADEALGGEVAANVNEAAVRQFDVLDQIPHDGPSKLETALDLDSDLGQALAAKTAINTRDFSAAADELLARSRDIMLPEGKEVALDAFAREVRSIADSEEVARFGDRKAYIGDLYDRAQASGRLPKMTLPEFKAALQDANREGYLTTARADLVQAMDPEMLARSEMSSPDGIARWHFVERGTGSKVPEGTPGRVVGRLDAIDPHVELRTQVEAARQEYRSSWGLGNSDMLTPGALRKFATGNPEQAFKAVKAFDDYSKLLNKLANQVGATGEGLKLSLNELKTITAAALPETAKDQLGTQLLATLALAGGADQVLPDLDGPFDDLLKLYLAHKVVSKGLLKTALGSAKAAIGIGTAAETGARDLVKHPVPSPASPNTKPGGLLKKLSKGKFPEFVNRSARLFGHRHGRTLAGGEGIVGSAGGAMGSVAGSMGMRALARVVFGADKMAGVTGSALSRLAKLTHAGAGGTEFAGRHGAGAALPVLNSLHFGSEREGRDLQEAFKYRAEEITSMYTNPTQTLEMVHNNLEGVRSAHIGVSDKLETWTRSAIEYLYNALPKDPGNIHMFGQSMWAPDDLAVAEFASRAWGVDAPLDALEATMRGAVDPFAMEAVRTVHPELFAEAQKHVMEDLPRLIEESTFDQRIALGQLLGVPTDSSLEPDYINFIKQHWTEREAQANPTQQPTPGAPVPMTEPATHSMMLQL